MRHFARREFTIKGRGRELRITSCPAVMGILNVTPDSFSDGGKYVDPAAAVERALEMKEEGADIIDVGGESTRPGAGPVPVEEEMKRVLPVIERLALKGLLVSIDTTKAEVAGKALDSGAWMVNDVSAMTADPAMVGVIRDSGAAVTLMHMRGTSSTMQANVEYKDLVGEVFEYLASRVLFAEAEGIDPESIVIDPGLGFGKSPYGNLELIGRLNEFSSLGRPVLVGPSRKSFIGVFGGSSSADRLPGTLAAVSAAVMNGASLIRVHDVRESLIAARVAAAVRDMHPPAEERAKRGDGVS